MSISVDQTWMLKFNDMVHMSYAQLDSLLVGMLPQGMVHRNIQAQIDHHERIGHVIANDVITPFGQTVILNPPHSRRAAALQSSDAAVLVSDEHTLRSMVDPTNPYTQIIVGALRRRSDKHVISSLTGNAMTSAVTAGTGAPTYGTQALPSARKLGTANTAINLVVIIGANVLLSKSGVPPGRGRVMLYSPGQIVDVMAITQASSSDFTNNRIHDSGTIDGIDWEGFLWKEMQDPMAQDGSTALDRMLALTADGLTRSMIAWHISCVGLSYGRDVTTNLGIRHDLNDSIQVRSILAMGGVRVWEGGVVEILAKEN